MVDLSGKAAIQIFGSRCAVGTDVEEGDGFVAVAQFAEFARSLEFSIRRRDGEFLVAGDFNAASAAWNGTRTDRRGRIVEDLTDKIPLVLVNRGTTWTFARRGTGSVVDITLATERLSRKVVGWAVHAELENLSYHRSIMFVIADDHAVVRADGGSRVSWRKWSAKNVDRHRLKAGLLVATWNESRAVTIDEKADG